MVKAKDTRGRADREPPRSADALFAGTPARFVQGGSLARVMRRLAEPRRSVKVPDAAHDFHGVWGVPLPRDLAAVTRAFAAIDMEWLGGWRPSLSEGFALPARAKDNLFERIVIEDQRDRRGTALVELIAGAPATGELRGGPRLLYGLYDAPTCPIWSWQPTGRLFAGPVAGDLSTLAWTAAVSAAQRERMIVEATAQGARARVEPAAAAR